MVLALLRNNVSFQALESYSKAVWSGGGRASLMHIAKLQQELGRPQQALEAIERYSKEYYSAFGDRDGFLLVMRAVPCAEEIV